MSYQTNRRKHRRNKVIIQYMLSKASSKMAKGSGYAVELSPGGVRIITRQQLTLNSFVNIHLESLHESKAVDVEGKVIWVRELELKENEYDEHSHYAAGIKFLNLHKEEDKKIIRELMRENRYKDLADLESEQES